MQRVLITLCLVCSFNLYGQDFCKIIHAPRTWLTVSADNNQYGISDVVSDYLSTPNLSLSVGLNRTILKKLNVGIHGVIGKVGKQSSTDSRASIQGIRLRVLYEFTLNRVVKESSPLRFLLGTDVGTTKVDSIYENEDQTTNHWTPLIVGASYKLSREKYLFAHISYNYSFNVNYRQFSVGIRIALENKERDGDGDGVADIRDRARKKHGKLEECGADSSKSN